MSTSLIFYTITNSIMKSSNIKLLERISNLNEKIEKFSDINIFRESWMTLWQYQLLKQLIENKVSTINDLKTNLIVSAPALSQILWRMELTWLISREINKYNKRETNIIVTPKALELYQEISKKYNNLMSSKLSKFDDSQIKELNKLLKDIEKNYNL